MSAAFGMKVKLLIEVEAYSGPWGDDATVGQVRKDATRSGHDMAGRVLKVLDAQGIRARVMENTTVQYVLTPVELKDIG